MTKSITTEIVPCYSPSADITFLMEETYINDEIASSEVVGFHYGKPGDEGVDVESAIANGVKIEYDRLGADNPKLDIRGL